MPDLAADLALALRLADVAGDVAMRRFRAPDLHVTLKPDGSVASDADLAVERAVREALARERPGDGVLGEEMGQTGPEGRRWVIDPIDGTANFVRGRSVWGILIALEVGGDPLVGIVSAPTLGRRWWAARGQGAVAAVAGGPPRPMRVSAVGRLADARLAEGSVSVSVSVEDTGAGALACLRDACRSVVDGGLGPLWVAQGEAEVGLADADGLWDLAPLLVIVEEAGGRMTDLGGARTVACALAVASNGLLHDQVLGVLRGEA